MVHCADAGIPELTRLTRTIDTWGEEFLAYFYTAGVSNRPQGPTTKASRHPSKISSTGRSPLNGQPFAQFSMIPVEYRTTARHSPRLFRYWWTRVPRYHWPSWRTMTSRGTGRVDWSGMGVGSK